MTLYDLLYNMFQLIWVIPTVIGNWLGIPPALVAGIFVAWIFKKRIFEIIRDLFR